MLRARHCVTFATLNAPIMNLLETNSARFRERLAMALGYLILLWTLMGTLVSRLLLAKPKLSNNITVNSFEITQRISCRVD